MGRASTLPKRLQPMLATLTDGRFDDPGWIFEDKTMASAMVAKIESGRVTQSRCSLERQRNDRRGT